jgi:hypothetical protein
MSHVTPHAAGCLAHGTAWLFPVFEVGAPELNHKKLSRLGGTF